MTIFPIPQHSEFHEETRDFSAGGWIVLPQEAGFPLKDRVMEIARSLTQFLHRPRVGMGLPSDGRMMVRMQRTSGLHDEGYHLTLEAEGPILLEASTDSGFFYGMQTAAQCLATPSQTPLGTIRDEPSLKERGYMLDVSRNKVPTMETLKKLVASLGALRYNSLQLYTEHTFAFAGHERVWADYSPLTAEEILELDEFCRLHFIELVPNLNSFGHLERWLRHPRYKHLAECETPYTDPGTGVAAQTVLQPNQESLDFIAGLYDEFLPNFTARKVNIGCDETQELGKGRSAEICRQKGTTQVYLDYLGSLAKLAAERGFSVEFWGDIIMTSPELIAKLPRCATALEWGYEENHPFHENTLKFKESGIPFLVCPGTSAWNTHLGRTTNMIGNIANAVTNGKENGARGMLMTDWGDCGHHQYYPVSWPGIAMGGGAAWNADAKETVGTLPQAIAMAFAPGKEGERMAGFLLEAGRIYDDFSYRCSNSTAYGRLFQAYRHEKMMSSQNRMMEHLTLGEVQKAIAHARRLLQELARAPFQGFPLENAEIENALRMAIAAMTFLERAVDKNGHWDQEGWTDELRHVIAEHERLWLARNRAGGLHESSNYLRNALDFDPDEWRTTSRR